LTNIFLGKAVSTPTGAEVETPVGRFPVEEKVAGLVQVLIRSDAAELEGDGFPLTGTVESLAFRGGWTRMMVQVNRVELLFDLDSNLALPEPGQPVTVSIDLDKGLHIFKNTP
jgi:hypothetical protein